MEHDYQRVPDQDVSRCSRCDKVVRGLAIWKAKRDQIKGHPEVLAELLGGECEERSTPG